MRFKILFALFYDVILLIAVWMAASVPFVIWQGGNFAGNAKITLAFQIYLIAITYLYLSYFWLQSGQTPGLRTWKLQLLDENNRLLGRYQANLRFLWLILLFLISWIGLFTPKKQLLHDQLAKTKIVSVSSADNS
ncbi:MAG: RDD family protein [Thiotrichales bacterium]|nr:RDD family protein [Thiotrichales bacterium]